MFKHIIPHIPQNTQVSFSKKADVLTDSAHIHPALKINSQSTIRQAFALYDAGLNVFPQPYGRKAGYPWQRLLYLRLSRDDANYGLRRLFAGRCNIAIMCGKTSGNLFVIDCETQEALQTNIAALRQRNIPLWAARTRRGGHIYLRAREGEVENIHSGTLADQEIKGRDGYVLAPPSLHPSGARYQWMHREGEQPPLVSIREIDWLRAKDGTPVYLQATRIPQQREILPAQKYFAKPEPLTRKTRDYLLNGSTVPTGERNNRLFAAACDLAGNGYSQEQALQMLKSQAQASGLAQQEIHSTIQSAFSKTRSPAKRSQDGHSVSYAWQEALAFAMHCSWNGRSNHSARTLFLALIERARLSSNEKHVFRASIRELSQMSRLGTATVQRLLRQFRAYPMPFLFHCGYDKRSTASLWRFSDYVLSQGRQQISKMDTAPLTPPWLSSSVSVFLTEAAERDALGLGGVFVYRFLLSSEYPLRRSELAQASGLSLHQVDYAIRKLVAHGLVHRSPQGYRVVNLGSTQALEQHVPGRGLGLARRLRYVLERQRFVGRILFDARLRAEGDRFVQANCFVWRAPLERIPDDCRHDSLITLGLELGAVVILEDGTWFDRQTLRR